MAGTKDLTAKQEAFCREYVVDFNGAQAATRAGYSAATAKAKASDLLKLDHISAQVFELTQEKTQRTEIDADSVLRRQDEVVDRCMAVERTFDLDGEDIEGVFDFNAKEANKGLANLGRFLGMGSTSAPAININLSEEKTRAAHRELLAIVKKHTKPEQFAAIVADLGAVGDA